MAKRTAEEQLVKGQEKLIMEGGHVVLDVAKPATAAQLAQRKIRSIKKRPTDGTPARNNQSFPSFQSSPTSFNFGANTEAQKDNTIAFGGQHSNPFSSQSFPPTNGAPAVGSQTPNASFSGFGNGTTAFNGFGASTQPSGGFGNSGSTAVTFGNSPAFAGFAPSNPSFGGFSSGAPSSGGTETASSTAFNFGGTTGPVFTGFGASNQAGNGAASGAAIAPSTTFNFGNTPVAGGFSTSKPSPSIFGNLAASSSGSDNAHAITAPAPGGFGNISSPTFAGFGSSATTPSSSDNAAMTAGFGVANQATGAFGNTVPTSGGTEKATSNVGVFGSSNPPTEGSLIAAPTVGFNFGAPASGSPATTGAAWTTLGTSKATTASPATSAPSLFPPSQINGAPSTLFNRPEESKDTFTPERSSSPSPSPNPFAAVKSTQDTSSSPKPTTPSESLTSKGPASTLFTPSADSKETHSPSASLTPSKNMFTSATPSQQATNMFGSSTLPAKASTNLFSASNTSADSPSTNMFAAPVTSSKDSTSVFAALNTPSKSPSPNMFSASATPSQSSTNMFSSPNTSSKPSSTNPLFSAAKPSTNAFTASSTAPSPSTNMFAAAKSSTNIFAASNNSPSTATNPLFAATKPTEANPFSPKPAKSTSEALNIKGASATSSARAGAGQLFSTNMQEDRATNSVANSQDAVMDENTIPSPPNHFSDAQVAYYYRDAKVSRLNKYFRESVLHASSSEGKYRFSDYSPLTTAYSQIMQVIKDELHEKLGVDTANYKKPLSKPSPPRFSFASNPSSASSVKRKADQISSPLQDSSKKAKPTPSSETAKKVEDMLAMPSSKGTATSVEKSTPLQLPTFGSYDPKALWKKQVEAQEAEAKRKRKAEEYDSEEDDEEEWERQDEEKQRAKKAKLEEERATAKITLSVPSISVNGDSSRSASPASVLEAPREKGLRNDNPFAQYASTHSGEDEDEEEDDLPDYEEASQSDASQKPDFEKFKHNPLFAATRDQNGSKPSSSMFNATPRTNGTPGPRGGLFSTTPSKDSQEEFPSGASSSPEGNPGDHTWKPGSAVTFGSPMPSTPTRGTGSSKGDPAIIVSAPTPIGATPDTISLFGSSTAAPKFIYANTLQDKIHLAPSVASSQPFSDITGAATPKSQDGESDSEEPGSSQFVSFEPEKEDHDFLFETELAKSLKYMPKSTDEVKWKTQGLGPMVVLKNRETGVRNIVMKATPSGQVVLNTRLFKDAEYKRMTPKRARFTVSTAGGLETWLVQFKDSGLVDEFVSVCEQNKS